MVFKVIRQILAEYCFSNLGHQGNGLVAIFFRKRTMKGTWQSFNLAMKCLQALVNALAVFGFGKEQANIFTWGQFQATRSVVLIGTVQ